MPATFLNNTGGKKRQDTRLDKAVSQIFCTRKLYPNGQECKSGVEPVGFLAIRVSSKYFLGHSSIFIYIAL
jgi:hypothetical protein